MFQKYVKKKKKNETHLELKIYFEEVKYPKVQHYVLQNHDRQLLLSYKHQGRQNRPSPYYDIDNSGERNETNYFHLI